MGCYELVCDLLNGAIEWLPNLDLKVVILFNVKKLENGRRLSYRAYNGRLV